jgi:hypothetical protein
MLLLLLLTLRLVPLRFNNISTDKFCISRVNPFYLLIRNDERAVVLYIYCCLPACVGYCDRDGQDDRRGDAVPDPTARVYATPRRRGSNRPPSSPPTTWPPTSYQPPGPPSSLIALGHDTKVRLLAQGFYALTHFSNFVLVRGLLAFLSQ